MATIAQGKEVLAEVNELIAVFSDQYGDSIDVIGMHEDIVKLQIGYVNHQGSTYKVVYRKLKNGVFKYEGAEYDLLTLLKEEQENLVTTYTLDESISMDYSKEELAVSCEDEDDNRFKHLEETYKRNNPNMPELKLQERFEYFDHFYTIEALKELSDIEHHKVKPVWVMLEKQYEEYGVLNNEFAEAFPITFKGFCQIVEKMEE